MADNTDIKGGYHKPIMLEECMDGLKLTSSGVYVDGTLGGGGHSYEILKRSAPYGKLYAFDKDIEAVRYSTERLKEFGDRVTIIHADFKSAPQELSRLGVNGIDGVLLDLGISSHQIDSAERGFSYMQDARLDMRMNTEQALSAYEVVNSYDHKDLYRIIREYGEDDFAYRIAVNIVAARPVETTLQLADIIKKSVPVKVAIKSGHPAKKTFQALRIEVNGELGGLDTALTGFVDMLKPGGRAAIMTFHSLEDRIVKNVFRHEAEDCICDKSMPVCICGHKARLKTVNKKPITASGEETKDNSRAASAKLRIAERLEI